MNDFYELVLEAPGKNALSTAHMESILKQLADAGDSPVLFRGAGDVFCAGLNLKEVASLDAAAMTKFVDLVERVMVAIFDHPGPTVACVNGHAIAGGCVITLCCDHRVMTNDASTRIGVNEIALGLTFPPKIFRIVEYRLPPRSKHEVMLRAALYAPADAQRLGIVDELSDDPRRVAEERVRELAALPRTAYIATKSAMHAGITAIDAASYAAALRATLPIWTSDEIRTRVLARLKK
jgi:enoyl-CoA hydratase